MRALTLLTVFSAGLMIGSGLAIGFVMALRARLRRAPIGIPVYSGSTWRSAIPVRIGTDDRPDRPRRVPAAFTELTDPALAYRAAELPDIPVGPYDPDEAVELSEEPTLYEDDDVGPHLIEPRIGEDEPETAGLPRRPTTRP